MTRTPLKRTLSQGDASPAALGFRMPAEWEPHRATWLVWPHNRADWEVKMSAIDWCFTEIVRHLAEGERVAVLFQNGRVEQRAMRALTRAGVDLRSVKSHRVRTNRSWIRDSGPIFVVRGGRNRIEVALTDWHFNGWARYRAWKDDDAVPSRLARCLGMRRFAVYCDEPSCRRRVVLEGGSIDVNGQGLLLTTEECLLSPVQERNPGMSKAELEAVFARNLGVRRVLWLRGGIAGDDTHGHVDDVARFVSARTVAAAMESDRTDENFEVLRENFERLWSMRDLSGRPLTILRLPMPRALYFEGQRLPASYLNFYIGNRRVLVPTFNDRNDRLALDRLRRAFPGREVVGIHAAELVLGLGAVHCLTQQEPGVPDDLN